MRGAALLTLISLVLTGCATSTPARAPDDREWTLLMADYQWIETLRKSAPVPAQQATRKEQIEILLASHRKFEPAYSAFFDKLRDYYGRTGDVRAAHLYAREKIMLGDEYMNVLSRYDKAIDLYGAALVLDPDNATARERMALAQSRRFVSIEAFSAVRAGMKEEEVRRIVGQPREDWIKQVVQKSRVYSVWIYPKRDGGASAIYFDNGLVYHTNWNAAAPPAARGQ
jgi:tetratricopeptide (TPR) repeat protein